MKLRELLNQVEVLELHADPDMEIGSLTYDSRKVEKGGVFAAVTGFAADGNRFIPMALEKGAAVIVTACRPQADIPYVLVASDRLALAQMSGNYLGNPARDMVLIGITGTNGKTSSTLLLKRVLEQCLDTKVGLIGTMENIIGFEKIPAQRTTPESLELQGLFARMRDAGCTHVVMEVSSHAITLERIGGLHYDIAAFTNLTEDHLDFHKTMDAYCDAKAELFRRCSQAVVNTDDPYADRICQAASCPVLRTSAAGEADLYAEEVELLAEGVRFTAVMGEQRVRVRLPIPGKFTVYNALTVLGIAVSLGIPLADAAGALAGSGGVKGRVEVVPTPGTDYSVLIDYAHSPDGLENVLCSVRGFCKGRVISVFGCGGDRDPMKRPIMGRIGVELSDIAVITSDNPRSEEPMAIIQDILEGVQPEMGTYVVIEDRRRAIRYAMDIAEKDDIIVLAGKGHETYQEINGVKYHLDEREEVAACLEELRNQNG